MNAYLFNYAKKDYVIVGENLSHALETWKYATDNRFQDPDSIACLGEAILPAQETKEEGWCLGCDTPERSPHLPECPANPARKPTVYGCATAMSCPACGAPPGLHHEECGLVERREP